MYVNISYMEHLGCWSQLFYVWSGFQHSLYLFDLMISEQTVYFSSCKSPRVLSVTSCRFNSRCRKLQVGKTFLRWSRKDDMFGLISWVVALVKEPRPVSRYIVMYPKLRFGADYLCIRYYVLFLWSWTPLKAQSLAIPTWHPNETIYPCSGFFPLNFTARNGPWNVTVFPWTVSNLQNPYAYTFRFGCSQLVFQQLWGLTFF